MTPSNSDEEVNITIKEEGEDIVIKGGAFTEQITQNPFYQELVLLLGTFVLSVVLFKIVFMNESIWVVGKTVISFYFLFIVPGFFIMNYWQEKLDFLERFLISLPLGAAITGGIGFLLGLVNVKMGIHMWVIPTACIVLGLYLNKKQGRKKR